MNSKECEEQLKSLIEHFKNGGLDFNATDIKAIEHLLLENRIQHDTIKKQNQENKELHNKINKLEDKITQMHKRFINELCIDNYLGGRKTKILFEEMFEILRDSDVDE